MDTAVKAKTGYEECLFVIKKFASDEKVISALEEDDIKIIDTVDPKKE